MLLSPSWDLGFTSVPMYFLILSLTYCLCLYWWIIRSQSLKLSLDLAFKISLIILCVGFLGSRLTHILYEHPSYYWQNPWDIFAIWKGGFVFYGGAIPTVWLSIYTLQKQQEDIKRWADFAAPIALFGYSLGRWASLWAGSCYGSPTALPWGVVYPAGVEAPAGVALHPIAAYESLWSLFWVSILLTVEKKAFLQSFCKITSGQVACMALFVHAAGRFASEFYRQDDRGPTFYSLTISSWISIALMSLSLFYLSKIRKSSSKIS